MKTILTVLAFFLTACTCPETKPVVIKVHDTIYRDVTCYRCIDSLKQLALAEVTTYREQSIYQIDTMRSNFLQWMDSMRKTRVWGNMIIKGDTLQPCIINFDNLGKPQILYK